MILKGSVIKTIDNSGAVSVKCIYIKGFNKRYAYTNDMIKGVAFKKTRYPDYWDKKWLSKRVQKHRKPKKNQAKVGRKKKIRPYEILIAGTKGRLHRKDGSYLNFDRNRAVVYTAPTTFGPHKKSTMIPNLVATAVRGPVCRELRATKWFSEKYRVLIKKAHTLV